MWSLLANIFSVVLTFGLVIYAYFKWTYQYWKRRNVPQLEPKFPFGDIKNPVSSVDNIGVQMRQIYNRLRVAGLKYCGTYHMASTHLLLTDLEMIKTVMTKDFSNFCDRAVYVNEEADPLSAHLFSLSGSRWRTLRAKLSPTFTSGKMKNMFHTLTSTAKFLEGILKKSNADKEPINIRDILAKFTTDIIGSCVFGLECNSLSNPDAAFKNYGSRVLQPDTKRVFLIFFCVFFPKIAKHFGVALIDSDVNDFYMNTVRETVEYRLKNNVERKDFLQLLIDLKKNNELTLNEIAAQCFVFFVAGFETSSTTMTFALYELARNPEIQEKVREEINQVLDKHEGEITYDAMNELVYLDQVVNETLRMYPPVPLINRICVNDTKIDDLVIQKGDVIDIPIMGLHYDPEYYHNPEKFDPEHFNEENKAKRHNYAHIPFGEGPRICIGMRFGLLQTKMGLATILKNYRVTLSLKTKLPIKIKTTTFVLSIDGDLYLNLEKVN